MEKMNKRSRCSREIKGTFVRSGKMKKVLLLMMLLGVVVSANATLSVVVRFPDQPMNVWQSYADSKLIIQPSDELYIGFSDDMAPADVSAGDVFYLGIAEGPGSLDVSTANALTGVDMATVDDAALAADLGLQNGFVMVSIVGQPAASMLAYNFLFHCEGIGDVTFYAYDENFVVVDTQVIHQIPEPATLGLFSLGMALAFRKRKA